MPASTTPYTPNPPSNITPYPDETGRKQQVKPAISVFESSLETLAIDHISSDQQTVTTATVRPILLLTLRLLRLLDSNFPINPLWASEFHPFKLRSCLSQTLRNPQCQQEIGRSIIYLLQYIILWYIIVSGIYIHIYTYVYIYIYI